MQTTDRDDDCFDAGGDDARARFGNVCSVHEVLEHLQPIEHQLAKETSTTNEANPRLKTFSIHHELCIRLIGFSIVERSSGIGLF